MEKNYYILLDLDPSVKDVPTIISAANKKIAEWNMTRDPRKQLHVKEMVVSFKSIINEVSKNPKVLEEHSEEYVIIKARERQEQDKAIRENASMLVIDGEIDESCLDSLSKKYNQFTKNEILQKIGARIKQKKSFRYSDDGIGELDSSTFNVININLQILNKRDLYDFLDIKATSSCKEIDEKRASIYDTNSKNANKDAKNTATGALCGLVSSILCNDEQRKRYNKSLENLIFKDIFLKIHQATLSNKIITAEQYKVLIDDCSKKGIGKDKAEFYIYQYCDNKKPNKITIIEPKDNDFVNQKTCRICSTSNNPQSSVCKTCAFPLIVICPQCSKRSIDSNELKCTQCGFSIGDMPNAETMVFQARKALSIGDIVLAQKYIEKAEIYWATYPPIAEIKEKITKENDIISFNLKKADGYRTNKEYVSLLSFIKTIKTDSPQFHAYKTEAENAITSAISILSRTKTLTDSEVKFDMYVRALSICTDLEEAKKELKISPPQAPANLRISAIGRTVRLNWDKLRSTHIKYVIVRKINGTPQNPFDGETIAILSDNKFDDVDTTPGLSYYYAVYSQCTDIYSRNAVVEGPVITISEISNSSLKYDIQEKHINFTCKFPQNAKFIEVFKDNALIKTLSSENFLDLGLVTEKVYSYKFVAIYEDCFGKKYRTNGIEVQLKPTAPPKPVELKVSSTSDKATISWVNPVKGILEIYHNDKPFSENKNDLVNTDSFKGEKILISGTSCVINKNFNGVRYYLPLTVSDKIGVAGQQIMITSILKPEDVSFDKVNERNIDIKWKWGNGIDTVRIRSRIDEGSSMDTDVYHSKTSLPKFTLSIPKDAKNIKVGIMTLFKSYSGEVLLSEPIERFFNLQTAKIDFVDVKKRGLFSKNKYEIILKANMPINSDLHLLIREGLPPSNINNYQSFLTIPAKDLATEEKVKYTIEYSKEDKSKTVMFRLIPADKTQLNSIVIIPEVKQVK